MAQAIHKMRRQRSRIDRVFANHFDGSAFATSVPNIEVDFICRSA